MTRHRVRPLLKMTADVHPVQENGPYLERVPLAGAIDSGRAMRESNE